MGSSEYISILPYSFKNIENTDEIFLKMIFYSQKVHNTFQLWLPFERFQFVDMHHPMALAFPVVILNIDHLSPILLTFKVTVT